MLAIFYVAIPVGSALGYAIGGFATSHWGWQTAFFAVAPPGVLLGLACFLRRDPRDEVKTLGAKRHATLRDYAHLIRIKSYVWNTLAMTAHHFCHGWAFVLDAGIFAVSRFATEQSHRIWRDAGFCRPDGDAPRRNRGRLAAQTFCRRVFFGVGNWSHDRVSVLRGGGFDAISFGVGTDVSCVVLSLFQHGSIKYGAGQCDASIRAIDGLCAQYLDHSRTG